MKTSVRIVLSLLVAAVVIEATGSAIAAQCPPNCESPPPQSKKSK
jgi:hypothetical protein